jgi:hypothetical protein
VQAKSFRSSAQRPVDLSPYFLSVDLLRYLVSSAPIENEETPGERILHACQFFRFSRVTFRRVRDSLIKCVKTSIDSGGEYFEHLL